MSICFSFLAEHIFWPFGGMRCKDLMLPTEAKGLQPPLCQMRSVSCVGGLKFHDAPSHCLSDDPAFFDVPILRSLFVVSSLLCVSGFLSISHVNVSHLELIRFFTGLWAVSGKVAL